MAAAAESDGAQGSASHSRKMFIVADCETTNLHDPRILELAASAYVGCTFTNPAYSFSALADPRMSPEPLSDIPDNPVHDLTAGYLDLHGAEPFAIVWDRFRSWLRRVRDAS